MTKRYADQVTGRRVGKAGAREFTLVAASAGVATLGLALMFGAAASSSSGAEPPQPTPVAATTGRSATTTATSSPSTATTSTTATTATTTTASAPTDTQVTTTVTEVVALPFTKQTVEDGALVKGNTVVRTAGRDGSKTVTWSVRTQGGIEVGRTVTREQVTRQPVTEVTAVGTKAPTSTPAPKPTSTTAAQCDPNYSGACVPVASDVDCAGGSGNGPAYVRGPVQVVGRDIYGLDADHDGIGCE